MNTRQKRALYESIMSSVAKLVKKALNEYEDPSIHLNLMHGGEPNITADNNGEALTDYLKDIRHNELLSSEDEYNLASIIVNSNNSQEVEEARTKLIKANVKFVISVAKRYKNAKKVYMSDIILAGNEGLIEATNHINLEKLKGNNFSSFAVWYIRRHIMQLLDNYGYGQKLPYAVANIVRSISRFRDSFYTKEGRYPSIEEIFNGLKNTKLNKDGNLTLSKVKEAIEAGGYNDEGLDDTIGKDDNGNSISFGDQTSSDMFDAPGSSLDDEDLKGNLEHTLIRVLGERNANVFMDRYGCCGHRAKQVWEIADDNDMTETNVNVILRNGLTKLKKDPVAKKQLMQFM